MDTRKATALLARLALDPDAAITRDTAVDLLWPNAPLDNARNSLRRTLSVLRSAIGTDVVEADRASIRLIREMVDLDVDRTALPDVTMHDHQEARTCPACVDPLWEAHRAFRGEFMEGFSLRDAPPFDDWMLRTAEELTSRHALVLARLTDALLIAGRAEEAAEVAGHWIEIDPLDESAHRRRIELLGRLGNRSAASDQFAECARILEEELGVSPLPETVRLLDSILSGATHEPVRRVPNANETLPTSPVGFFGRDKELALVADAARRRSSLLVIGDPGVGKSRLVEEAAALVAAEGMPVASVRAVGGDASLPFLLVQRTLAEALEGFSGTLPESAAPALEILPDLRSAGLYPTSIPDGPLGRLRILDAVGTALDGLLGNCVVVIDDVHLADEDSLAALHHLLGRRARPWALVLVGQPNPPTLALGDDTDDTLRLGPLGAEAVAAMVDAHLGSSDPSLAEALLGRTGGNPFFLEQCLRSTDPTTSVPSSVQASVERRLSALDPLAVQVLGVASVLRRPHPLDLIRRVALGLGVLLGRAARRRPPTPSTRSSMKGSWQRTTRRLVSPTPSSPMRSWPRSGRLGGRSSTEGPPTPSAHKSPSITRRLPVTSPGLDVSRRQPLLAGTPRCTPSAFVPSPRRRNTSRTPSLSDIPTPEPSPPTWGTSPCTTGGTKRHDRTTSRRSPTAAAPSACSDWRSSSGDGDDSTRPSDPCGGSKGLRPTQNERALRSGAAIERLFPA